MVREGIDRGDLPVGVLGRQQHPRIAGDLVQGPQGARVRHPVVRVHRLPAGRRPHRPAQRGDRLVQHGRVLGGLRLGEQRLAEVVQQVGLTRVAVRRGVGRPGQQRDRLLQVGRMTGGGVPLGQRVGEVVRPDGPQRAALRGAGQHIAGQRHGLGSRRGVPGPVVPGLQDHTQVGQMNQVRGRRAGPGGLPGQAGGLAQGGQVAGQVVALAQRDREVRHDAVGPPGPAAGHGLPQRLDGLVQQGRVSGPLAEPVQGVAQAVQPVHAGAAGRGRVPDGRAQQVHRLTQQRRVAAVLGGQPQCHAQSGQRVQPLGSVRPVRGLGQGRPGDAEQLGDGGLVGRDVHPRPQRRTEAVQHEGAVPRPGRALCQRRAPQVEPLAQGLQVPRQAEAVLPGLRETVHARRAFRVAGRQMVQRTAERALRLLQVARVARLLVPDVEQPAEGVECHRPVVAPFQGDVHGPPQRPDRPVEVRPVAQVVEATARRDPEEDEVLLRRPLLGRRRSAQRDQLVPVVVVVVRPPPEPQARAQVRLAAPAPVGAHRPAQCGAVPLDRLVQVPAVAGALEPSHPRHGCQRRIRRRGFVLIRHDRPPCAEMTLHDIQLPRGARSLC